MMFGPGQEIIYRKNGEEISRLNQDFLKELPLPMNILQYIAGYQPFVEPGISLTIPRKEERDVLTTSEIKSTERKGNALVVHTCHSTYEIEYVNIDLEKILQAGKGLPGVSENEFPYPED